MKTSCWHYVWWGLTLSFCLPGNVLFCLHFHKRILLFIDFLFSQHFEDVFQSSSNSCSFYLDVCQPPWFFPSMYLFQVSFFPKIFIFTFYEVDADTSFMLIMLSGGWASWICGLSSVNFGGGKEALFLLNISFAPSLCPPLLGSDRTCVRPIIFYCLTGCFLSLCFRKWIIAIDCLQVHDPFFSCVKCLVKAI